jgi:cytochrome P450
MTDARLTLRHDIERVLADPSFEVPAAPAGDHGVAWLRSTVSRFVNGAVHARRRAVVEAELGRLDPAALRREARLRTDAVLDAASGRIEAMASIARPVPLATLGRALGVAEEELEGVVADAIAVAPAYASGAGDDRVDAAVERLRRLLDTGGPEQCAAAIAVLVQACEATAAVIGDAIVIAARRPELRSDVDALLDETLLRASPVRLMRRVSPDGVPVTLDLEAAVLDARVGDAPLAFGSGVRPCPGAAQALALASGVLDALLPRCDCDLDSLAWADSPALRLPQRLDLADRAAPQQPERRSRPADQRDRAGAEAGGEADDPVNRHPCQDGPGQPARPPRGA